MSGIICSLLDGCVGNDCDVNSAHIGYMDSQNGLPSPSLVNHRHQAQQTSRGSKNIPNGISIVTEAIGCDFIHRPLENMNHCPIQRKSHCIKGRINFYIMLKYIAVRGSSPLTQGCLIQWQIIYSYFVSKPAGLPVVSDGDLHLVMPCDVIPTHHVMQFQCTQH